MKQALPCLLLSLLLVAPFAAGGCSATSTRPSTGEYIDDATVTAKVKSALLADSVIKSMDVSVETFRGVVQLSGFVDNSVQQARAAEIARGVNGVRDVVNNLQLKTPPPAR
jgi:osmotically-inducible protein OsmY